MTGKVCADMEGLFKLVSVILMHNFSCSCSCMKFLFVISSVFGSMCYAVNDILEKQFHYDL
jgi:hypothetical protein